MSRKRIYWGLLIALFSFVLGIYDLYAFMECGQGADVFIFGIVLIFLSFVDLYLVYRLKKLYDEEGIA